MRVIWVPLMVVAVSSCSTTGAPDRRGEGIVKMHFASDQHGVARSKALLACERIGMTLAAFEKSCAGAPFGAGTGECGVYSKYVYQCGPIAREVDSARSVASQQASQVTPQSLSVTPSISGTVDSLRAQPDLRPRSKPPECGTTYISPWTNCYGVKNYANGHSYAGEFKEGNYHGWGIYNFNDGRPAQEGIWADNKFVRAERIPDFISGRPVIGSGDNRQRPRSGVANQTAASPQSNIDIARKKCGDLGLKSGTEKFGECVLRLSK